MDHCNASRLHSVAEAQSVHSRVYSVGPANQDNLQGPVQLTIINIPDIWYHNEPGHIFEGLLNLVDLRKAIKDVIYSYNGYYYAYSS